MDSTRKLKIGIFCSASDDLAPVYYEQTTLLGRWIGQQGHSIVYGGTRQGLMECVAKAVADNGGTVIGIMPQFMYDNKLASNTANKIIVTHDMVERKNRMMGEADLFIALPGGFGTWDEIFHVVACHQVGVHCKPTLLLNMQGFYDHLIAQAQEARRQKFTTPRFQQGLTAVNSIDECTKKIETLFSR